MTHQVHHVHHVPGRLRIRIPELKRDADKSQAFAKALRGIAGVQVVETNVLTGSLLVYYEEKVTNERAILRVLGIEHAIPAPSSAGSTRLERKVADAVLWYALEKAVERSVPLLLAALL